MFVYRKRQSAYGICVNLCHFGHNLTTTLDKFMLSRLMVNLCENAVNLYAISIKLYEAFTKTCAKSFFMVNLRKKSAGVYNDCTSPSPSQDR